ncbi:MAG: DUF2141 domain-containing protein [Sphingomonadaceae bacterium]
MKQGFRIAAATLTLSALALTPAASAQYRNTVAHNPASCNDAGSPKIRVQVNGVKEARGTVRAQVYYGTKGEWLEKGKWLTRVETPARAGTMTFCLPVPAAGTYAVAVRHDVNNNGKTDLSTDGGGMSNNPPINLLNLGRPSHTRTAFQASAGVTTISINMRYR